jgi:hypothetical protein
MKYICLGYMDPKKWESMSESEVNAFVDECFTYDDILRKKGHLRAGRRFSLLRTRLPCGSRTGR